MFLWLVNSVLTNIPGFVWPLITAVCLFVVLLCRIFSVVPYTNTVSAAALLLSLLCVFLWGSAGANQIYAAQLEQAQAKVAEAEKSIALLNKQLEDTIDAKTKIIHDTKVVFKTQVKTIAAKIDSVCKVDPAAIEALNQIVATGKK